MHKYEDMYVRITHTLDANEESVDFDIISKLVFFVIQLLGHEKSNVLQISAVNTICLKNFVSHLL